MTQGRSQASATFVPCKIHRRRPRWRDGRRETRWFPFRRDACLSRVLPNPPCDAMPSVFLNERVRPRTRAVVIINASNTPVFFGVRLMAIGHDQRLVHVAENSRENHSLQLETRLFGLHGDDQILFGQCVEVGKRDG